MKNNESGLTTMTMDKEKEELALYMQRVKGIKNYSDLPEMESNPFICLIPDELNDSWKKVQSGSSIVPAMDGDGGMIVLKDQRVFYRPVHVDKASYTKLFRRNLKEMFTLTYGALKVFGYIMDSMNFLKNPDLVYIDIDEVIEWCEYGKKSKSGIYRSLVELSNKGYICKTSKAHVFYINPAHAFNGNRITLVTDYFLTDNNVSEVKFGITEHLYDSSGVHDGSKLNGATRDTINDFE